MTVAKRDIFIPRLAYKPIEYPELDVFRVAINNSYWLNTEWTFESDAHDFRTKLDDHQRIVSKRSFLAISQIEVAIKKFWVKIGEDLPKPEIDEIGVTFGESEVRHARSYANILESLGLNDEFASLLETPIIKDRVAYLQKSLKRDKSDRRNFVRSLTLFAMLTENISLFSQFLIVKSFNKYGGYFKDIDNVIMASAIEETLHAQFGASLVHTIRYEHPELFDDEFWKEIDDRVRQAVEIEGNLVEWIMDGKDLPWLTIDVVKEFLKDRANYSLEMLGRPHLYEVDKKKLRDVAGFFDRDIKGVVNFDFFNKKPNTYTKRAKAITKDQLFRKKKDTKSNE